MLTASCSLPLKRQNCVALKTFLVYIFENVMGETQFYNSFLDGCIDYFLRSRLSALVLLQAIHSAYYKVVIGEGYQLEHIYVKKKKNYTKH